MTKISSTLLLEKAAELFSVSGYDAFSIRTLAQRIPITPSVIYHYYDDKDSLLKAMFDYANRQLGQARAELPHPKSASKMLMQRIEFQLDHADLIVAVLKYYLTYRNKFPRFEVGFVPDKSSLHIEEVLEYGVKTGEFVVDDLKKDAKVITHAINGFLLEYYPYRPEGKEKKELITTIYTFLVRALRGGDNK
jgi:AcrR family transcriptional regulator